MDNINKIRLFVSCPSDIKDEIDSIKVIIDKINKTHGNQNSYIIEVLNWNIDTYTQIGEDGQDVINKQLEDKYDILVGLMWLKVGTPTKRDKSGTIEEINRSLLISDKHQLIYFKTEPPDDLNEIDLKEYAQVKEFKENLKSKGVLYKEYKSIKSFDSLFGIHLPNLIFDKILPSSIKGRELPELSEFDVTKESNENEKKYSRIVELINKVRNKDKDEIDLDIFSATEKSSSYLRVVTSSITSIGNSMDEWTKNMEKRTLEMTQINNIKDDRLRIAKQKTVINLFAQEILEFNNKIQNELPSFSDNFRQVGPSYSEVFLIANKFKGEETKSLMESALELRNNVESSLESLAILLETTMSFPPLNLNFNKARRELELSLNDLMSETLEGLKLLDDALNI